jgi:hypothetical protein
MQQIKRFLIAALAAFCAVGLALSKDDEGQRNNIENMLQVPSCPIRLPPRPLHFYLRITYNSTIQSASPHPPPPPQPPNPLPFALRGLFCWNPLATMNPLSCCCSR